MIITGELRKTSTKQITNTSKITFELTREVTEKHLITITDNDVYNNLGDGRRKFSCKYNNEK